MKIISFIERGQQDVVERILRHCGLWEGPIRTLAGARAPPHGLRPSWDEPELVMDPGFLSPNALSVRRTQPANCSWCSILTSSNQISPLPLGEGQGVRAMEF